jgi:hypothetical protein
LTGDHIFLRCFGDDIICQKVQRAQLVIRAPEPQAFPCGPFLSAVKLSKSGCEEAMVEYDVVSFKLLGS